MQVKQRDETPKPKRKLKNAVMGDYLTQITWSIGTKMLPLRRSFKQSDL